MTLQISLDKDPLDRVGIGFKPRYVDELLTGHKSLGWLEIHAENYMVAGGPKRAMLEALSEDYPISCHGVGLSIGAESALDQAHLARLRTLQDWLRPALFSEHLAWSSHGRNYYNDLLPLPYTDATLASVVAHLDQLQQVLGRQVLLENPSSYLRFEISHWHEAEFLSEVVHRSGCGLLLDVNNVHVSARNLHFNARDYLMRLPLDAVGEIHLAGHAVNRIDGDELLIDSHDEPVATEVWSLFRDLLQRIAPCPVLIERDGKLPAFDVLAAEVRTAASMLGQIQEAA
jgi:uncharacterized protein (UPF0276 family)